ncbi:Fic family protein [Shimia sp. R9_2]|uniref:Fic family protein n=1 Tax=Shimia sp. R9_2 TaxID=2821112 RepID=UPI001ADC7078|nr:Fic family protein [Shimia sp. R9_2]
MPDWDADSDQLTKNLKHAYRASRDAAFARKQPTLQMARDWHARTLEGLTVPDVVLSQLSVTAEALSGRFRGETGLTHCEVGIGGHRGTPAFLVSEELARFEERIQSATTALDALIPQGDAPNTGDLLNAVLELCAWVHAEWVRIHPFANGNGRTARIWSGFIAMRYGLPPFVRLRPRPDDGYGAACDAAMTGDWTPTAQVFRRMYLSAIS